MSNPVSNHSPEEVGHHSLQLKHRGRTYNYVSVISIYLRMQEVSSLDQLPSGWHVLVDGPLKSYPFSQEYTAVDGKVVVVTLMMVFCRALRGPQSTAADT